MSAMRSLAVLSVLLLSCTEPETSCDALFSAPAGADLLCDESVAAPPGSPIAEIHWTSYATTDASSDVTARYRAWAARCGASVEPHASGISIARGTTTLEVHDTSAHEGPSCRTAPREDQRTVIVVSTTRRRPS
jgi:hypothetical protein